MSTQVQLRRGNTTQTNAFTGVVAEVTVDTDKNTIVVHNGSTSGGFPLARESTVTTVGSYANSAYIHANAAFAKANTAEGTVGNLAFAHANSSYIHANAAFAAANTSPGVIGNLAFAQANASFDAANSASSYANGAFVKANTANTLAQAAFDKANSVQSFLTFDANGTSVVADSQTDTITVTPANGIIVTGNASTDSITFGLTELAQGNTGSQIFVSPNGNDSNDGLATSRAKRTIRAGMNAARPFTQVTIASGTYEEITPIIVPQFVQVKGDGERTTIIKPVNTSKDIFWVNNGCWISCMKFEGYLANAVAFPSSTISSNTAQSGGANTITLAASEDVLDGIYRDMTISITSGTGAGQGKIISSYNGTTKVVTANSAWSTQPDNTSVYVIKIPLSPSPVANTARWSTFITASPYVYVCSSGTTTGTGLRVDGSLANGNKSIIAAQFTQVNVGGKGFHVSNDGYSQLVSIFGIFCDIAFLAESGGTASMGNCNVNFGNKGLVANGKGALAMTATFNGNTAVGSFSANLNNVVANTDPFFTVNATEPYVGLIGIVNGDTSGTYYYVTTSSPISSGQTVVQFRESLDNVFTSGTTINFYQQSQLRASGQTFEFVGAGTSLSTALPRNGGVPNTALQIVRIGEGAVFATSTDQDGNFQVSDLSIDQATGTISGTTFTKSLFAQMTPFILALEG